MRVASCVLRDACGMRIRRRVCSVFYVSGCMLYAARCCHARTPSTYSPTHRRTSAHRRRTRAHSRARAHDPRSQMCSATVRGAWAHSVSGGACRQRPDYVRRSSREYFHPPQSTLSTLSTPRCACCRSSKLSPAIGSVHTAAAVLIRLFRVMHGTRVYGSHPHPCGIRPDRPGRTAPGRAGLQA